MCSPSLSTRHVGKNKAQILLLHFTNTRTEHRSKGLKAPSWSERQDVLHAQTWAHTANSAVDINISKSFSVVEMYNLLLFRTWRLYSPPLLRAAAPVPEQEQPQEAQNDSDAIALEEVCLQKLKTNKQNNCNSPQSA